MTSSASLPPSVPPIAPRRRWLARVRDRLVASDPAFSRLRLAARALISIVLTALALIALTEFHALPYAAYGLATIIGFMGSIAIRDKTATAQVVTRTIAGLASVATVTLAGALAGHTLASDLAFLVVIFAAVYVRQYGPRGFAVGMVAFMSYFMGDYLHPPLDEIGWVALAAAIALLATHLVSSVLLPDDPERDFRRASVTIDRRVNLILRELRRAARSGRIDATNRRFLNDHIARLHDVTLMAEGFIPQGKGGALAGHGEASDLAVKLFDLQLAVERLAAASRRALPPDSLTAAVLYGEPRLIAAAVEALKTAPETNETATEQVLLRLNRARERLAEALARHPMPAFADAPDNDEAEETSASPESEAVPRQGLVPANWHLPIQVTLASALAMGGGLLISSTRWYWAVIAAFLVFNNTRSRADTAQRALQRSAGTFGGIIVGTVVATLLHGNMAVSIGGVFLCFFCGFYFLQTSYGVMIFFITIALALIYGLMGLFTPALLVLRLEETVIGALAGVFTAFFVFPKRATVGVTEALDAYLALLGELVQALRLRLHGQQGHSDILALSRRLDKQLAELTNAARPLGGPWNVVQRYGEVREKLLLFTGCTHWARALASGISHGETLQPRNLAKFDRLADHVARQIEHARATKRRFFLKPEPAEDNPMPRDPRRNLAMHEDESPLVALAVISTLLERAMSGPWKRVEEIEPATEAAA